MTYKGSETKYSDGSSRREWKNRFGEYHREFGPAVTLYNSNGSIISEYFYINGTYFGSGESGFWNLWERLTEDERQNPEILKCLSRYS